MTSEQAKRALSENIDRRLTAAGWSRYKLSQVAGVTEQTIANICNGVCEPRVSIATRIAVALNVSLESLLEPSRRNLSNSRKKVVA